ncbi:MAG: hypothetical protein JRN50_02260, partial [Nitrososphaerota archaeon]|nr:hypothetical protein [Nitrososphaerota archaeon]
FNGNIYWCAEWNYSPSNLGAFASELNSISYPSGLVNEITSSSNTYTFTYYHQTAQTLSVGQTCYDAGTKLTVNVAGTWWCDVSAPAYSATVSYAGIVGGGSPTAPNFNFVFGGKSYAYPMTTTPEAVQVDPSTAWSVTNPLGTSTSSERWETTSTSSGTLPSDANSTIAIGDYYNQYSFTFSYSVIDGGSPPPPTLSCTQFGSAYSPSLTGASTPYWCDASQAWSVTNPLGGSGSTERWDSAQTTSGTASAAVTTAYAYYHQYLQTLSYSVIGGGSPTAPTATGEQYGAAYAPTLTTTATGYWFDSTGSVAFSTSAGATGERWAPGPASVSATTSNTQVVGMYHQYNPTVKFTLTDSYLTTAPWFSYTSFGTSIKVDNSKTGITPWIDAGSTWNAQSPFVTSPDLTVENANATGGTADSATHITIAYSTASSCASASVITEFEDGCIVPAILSTWSMYLGSNVWLSFVLLGVNVAIWNRTQSVMVAMIVLMVVGGVFFFALPSEFGTIAVALTSIAAAGFLVKLWMAAH